MNKNIFNIESLQILASYFILIMFIGIGVCIFLFGINKYIGYFKIYQAKIDRQVEFIKTNDKILIIKASN